MNYLKNIPGLLKNIKKGLKKSNPSGNQKTLLDRHNASVSLAKEHCVLANIEGAALGIVAILGGDWKISRKEIKKLFANSIAEPVPHLKSILWSGLAFGPAVFLQPRLLNRHFNPQLFIAVSEFPQSSFSHPSQAALYQFSLVNLPPEITLFTYELWTAVFKVACGAPSRKALTDAVDHLESSGWFKPEPELNTRLIELYTPQEEESDSDSEDDQLSREPTPGPAPPDVPPPLDVLPPASPQSSLSPPPPSLEDEDHSPRKRRKTNDGSSLPLDKPYSTRSQKPGSQRKAVVKSTKRKVPKKIAEPAIAVNLEILMVCFYASIHHLNCGSLQLPN